MIRTATEADIDALMVMEAESWSPATRHTKEETLERVRTQPPRVFLLHVQGETLGVIYTQRIDSVDAILNVTWVSGPSLLQPGPSLLPPAFTTLTASLMDHGPRTLSSAQVAEDKNYNPAGNVLQLFRVNTYVHSTPAVSAGLAVGAILRDFCLHYARVSRNSASSLLLSLPLSRLLSRLGRPALRIVDPALIFSVACVAACDNGHMVLTGCLAAGPTCDGCVCVTRRLVTRRLVTRRLVTCRGSGLGPHDLDACQMIND